jgi:hypothetical protein
MKTRISALAPKPGAQAGLIRICDPADLELLSSWPRHGAAVLDFPELDPQENRTWERRLQRATATCGCREATACLMIAILLYVLGIVFIGVPETLTGRVLGLPAAAVAGLAIGKNFRFAARKRQSSKPNSPAGRHRRRPTVSDGPIGSSAGMMSRHRD